MGYLREKHPVQRGRFIQIGASTETRLSGRSLAILVTGLVTFGMGFSLIFAILPPLGRQLGFQEIQVGAVFAVGAVFLFLCAPFWGRRSDRWGRKPVLLIGFVGYTITQLIFVVFIHLGLVGILASGVVFGLLLLSRAAFAATVSAVNAPATAFIADTTTPGERTAKLAWINAAFGIGAILGPGVGALLSGLGLLVPLYAICVWALAMAVLIWLFLPEPARQRTQSDAVKLKLTDKRILPVAVITSASFFAVAANLQLAGFYVQDRLRLDATDTSQSVGVLLTVMAITALVTQIGLVRRLRWHPYSLLALGLPLGAAGFIGLILTQAFAAFAGFFVVIGIAIGLVAPALSGAASLAVSAEEQGGVAGLIEASRSIGFFVAAMGGSALYELGPRVPYSLTAAVLVALSAFAAVLWRRRSTPFSQFSASGADPARG